VTVRHLSSFFGNHISPSGNLSPQIVRESLARRKFFFYGLSQFR